MVSRIALRQRIKHQPLQIPPSRQNPSPSITPKQIGFNGTRIYGNVPTPLFLGTVCSVWGWQLGYEKKSRLESSLGFSFIQDVRNDADYEQKSVFQKVSQRP